MRFAVRARPLLFSLLVTGGLIGCSLIVPNDVPSYHCTGTDPAACPSGLVCDPVGLVCVAPSSLVDGGDDVLGDDDDGGDADQPPPDGPVGPSPLGGNCVIDTDCESGLLCGTSSILTTTIVPANSKSVCTHPCCTSADCASGFVCFAPGTGGNYCVAGKKASRTLPTSGGKSGGLSCTGPSDCRSGLCTTGRCVDTCCDPGQCGNGTTCRIATVDGHTAWACGLPNAGGGDLKQSCTIGDNSTCKNDNCVQPFAPPRCTPTCCSANDCTALGFTDNVCAYGADGNDQLKWCFAGNASGDPVGSTCTVAGDCASRYCDGELHKCANVCCTSSDCASGETCRPTSGGTPFLRCVKDR